MNTTLRSAVAVAGLLAATQAAATITFYEREGFEGRTFATAKPVPNFQVVGFNDRASSVIVAAGRWEACDDARFSGRCVVLRPGQYGSLGAMGLNDRVSSVRPVGGNARLDENRYAPAPVAAYDYRRRGKERVFEADVTSVRAVLGAAEQRCWIEREQLPSDSANMRSALVGAVIGGILGHEMGNGGPNAGRSGRHGYGQDVQRCSTNHRNATPSYWDVTYRFRGQEHRVQMAAAPGRTITVNAQGEPRA